MRRRVVITGIGVVAPNGIGKDDFWEALVSGKSAITKITRFDVSSYPYQIAGEVKRFDPADFMTRKIAKRTALFAQFALAAARLAVWDCGLTPEMFCNLNAGVFLGDSIGGLDLLEEQVGIFHEKGIRRLSPFASVMFFSHAAASHVGIEFNIRGPAVTVSTGCPAGANAIRLAAEEIRRGNIDIAVVGGTDAPISPVMVAALSASGSLASNNGDPEKASRPFDRNRSGWVLSEGAGILVLEEFRHADSRSANLYGEVLGCSLTNDACGVYEIDRSGDGLYRSMKNALSEAHLIPEEIEYISAHAPSMVLTDQVEVLAIKRLFKEYAYRVPVSSIKSMIGQPLAATGIFQLIACLLGMRDRTLPPTINYEQPDPDCDLDCVPNKARGKTIRTALVNTHGYGGINCSVVVGKIA
ncbi:MAG: beta-ketoacyl-[acyl-carrier-protein] synthase family protein [Deltaproteobacteria bacterium]|nr:beta-ketoacyl-[acyl-carrier-protein] synthase family protein [Deltaproteobacteria bacterium]MBW2120539.1 beta-ketoacyl-[acyl-carrier-protein] synthase family protein [Deltaproteobacteria bacterium]